MERIEISGPAASIDSLAAALAAIQTDGQNGALRDGAREAGVADESKARQEVHSQDESAAAGESAKRAADDGEIRLVIEVIDETATGAGEGQP